MREGESGREGEGETETPNAAELVVRDAGEEPVVELKLHNLHNCIMPESSATHGAADSCEQIPPGEKSVDDACTAAAAEASAGAT
jgi:hypothetical protein